MFLKEKKMRISFMRSGRVKFKSLRFKSLMINRLNPIVTSGAVERPCFCLPLGRGQAKTKSYS